MLHLYVALLFSFFFNNKGNYVALLDVITYVYYVVMAAGSGHKNDPEIIDY